MPSIASHAVRHTAYYSQVNSSGAYLSGSLRNTVNVSQSDERPEFCKKQNHLIPVRHITSNGVSHVSFRKADYPVTIPGSDIAVTIEKYLHQSIMIESDNSQQNKENIARFFSSLVSIKLTLSSKIYTCHITALPQEIAISDDGHALRENWNFSAQSRLSLTAEYGMAAVYLNADSDRAGSLSMVSKQCNETLSACLVNNSYTVQSQGTDTAGVLVSENSCEYVYMQQQDIQVAAQEVRTRNDTDNLLNSGKRNSFFVKIWDRFKAIFHSDGKPDIITGTVTESIISGVTEVAASAITIKSAHDYKLIVQSHVATAAYVQEFCQRSQRKTSVPVVVGQEFMPNTDSNTTSYTLPFYYHSLSPYVVKDLSCSQKIQLAQRKEAVKDDLDYDGALITKDGAIRIGTLNQLDWHNLPGIIPKTGTLSGDTLIYINGQNTPVYSQVTAMQAIADAYGVKVLGIHTATHGHQFKDGLQSLEDKLNMSTGPAKALEKLILNYLLENNAKEKPLRLMAHSRGGIITSHALTNVYEKLTQVFQQLPDVNKKKARQIARELMADIKVTTLAGGAYHYPQGPDYEHWINKKDPVPMIFGAGEYGKEGKNVHFFSATTRKHNVDTYLKHIQQQCSQLSDDEYESTWL